MGKATLVRAFPAWDVLSLACGSDWSWTRFLASPVQRPP